MTFGTGDTVNSKILSYNRDRIYSLGIFTSVFLIPQKINNKNIIEITVEESWYIYPIPFVELRERDWKKISYGVDFEIRNLGGRNVTFHTRIGLGYDPSLTLFYNYPYILSKAKIDLNANISYLNSKNRSLTAYHLYGSDFNQKNYSISIDIGKRLGLFNRIDLLASYNYIETPFYIKGISASSSRIDRTPSIGLGLTHDTRDLVQFPRTGLFANAWYIFKGLGNDGINYRIASLDYREYRVIFPDLLMKWRFAGRFSFGGLVPYYDYSFLGYQERIRGYFNYEMEGNDSYLGSFELNYPLIKDMNISLNFIPLIPEELLSYRIALYLELFTDTGTTLYRGQHLSLNDFHTGYGTGLTFLILPYNILRVEYALNKVFRGELIVGLGISF